MNPKQGIMPIRTRKIAAVLSALALLAAGLLLALLPRGTVLKVRQVPAGERDRYTLSMVMHEDMGTVSVRERVTLENRSGRDWDRVVLRFWLNALRTQETSPAMLDGLASLSYPDGFSPGEARVMGVFLGDEALSCTWLDAEMTVLSVPVALAAGETCEIDVNAVLTVPRMRGRTGRSGDLWTLGNAIPVLAPYDAGTGEWRTDPYSPIGDPFMSECADWSVRVSAGEDWQVLGSAPFERLPDGSYRADGTAMRDFLVVLSRGARSVRTVYGGVTVEVLTPADADVSRACARMLDCFSGHFGACPYPYLCVIALDFPFSGMEYPGAVLLSNELFDGAGGWELTLAHETAHQWFYALVLSDQVNHAWQDEGACEYAVLLWGREAYGASSEELLRYRLALSPMEESGFEVTAGTPIGFFPDYETYHTLVYGHGCAYFCALDTYLGGRLDEFLREYCGAYAYGFASRADFEDSLRRFAGADLSALTADYLDTLE